MTKESFEKYKAILDKYRFPYKNGEDILEVIANVRDLARVILGFEQKKNRLKSYANRK